jgi:hypothetical protein
MEQRAMRQSAIPATDTCGRLLKVLAFVALALTLQALAG